MLPVAFCAVQCNASVGVMMVATEAQHQRRQREVKFSICVRTLTLVVAHHDKLRHG